MGDDQALRTEALESLLVEQGLVSTGAIDAIVKHYESEVGPMNGRRVVARAWVDPAYKERLLADGSSAIGELGIEPRRVIIFGKSLGGAAAIQLASEVEAGGLIVQSSFSSIAKANMHPNRIPAKAATGMMILRLGLTFMPSFGGAMTVVSKPPNSLIRLASCRRFNTTP